MHSSTLLEFFHFFISHNYVCGGDLVLILRVFMKKKEKEKKNLLQWEGCRKPILPPSTDDHAC